MINFQHILDTLTICSFSTDFKQEIEDVIAQLHKGNLILAGGNGGSASDAEHFVAELTGRFNGQTNVVPAMCMASNFAEVTAFGNDYGYDEIFIPYCIGFPEASFLFITTSGSSKNIIKAIEFLIHRNQFMDGKNGIAVLTGDYENNVMNMYSNREDVSVVFVPSKNTQIIQEVHIVLLHYIAQEINNKGLY